MDLQVPPRQPFEPMRKAVVPRFCTVYGGELTSVHSGHHPQLFQMLAKTDINLCFLRYGKFYIQQACGFFLQIYHHEYAVTAVVFQGDPFC